MPGFLGVRLAERVDGGLGRGRRVTPNSPAADAGLRLETSSSPSTTSRSTAAAALSASSATIDPAMRWPSSWCAMAPK